MTTCTLLRALHDYWAQTGLPCRLEGHADAPVEKAHLLFTAGRGDFGEMTPVKATVWFNGQEAVKQRAETAETMERLLPRDGMKLATKDGMVLLERDGEKFMEMIADKADTMTIGLCVRAQMRVYG